MGKFPLECIQTIDKIAKRVEPEINYWKRFDDKDKIVLTNLEDNITYSTCIIAKNTNADAIVAYTHTGDSARRLSGMGAGCPIIAITDNKRTFRQLGLAWNGHGSYRGHYPVHDPEGAGKPRDHRCQPEKAYRCRRRCQGRGSEQAPEIL